MQTFEIWPLQKFLFQFVQHTGQNFLVGVRDFPIGDWSIFVPVFLPVLEGLRSIEHCFEKMNLSTLRPPCIFGHASPPGNARVGKQTAESQALTFHWTRLWVAINFKSAFSNFLSQCLLHNKTIIPSTPTLFAIKSDTSFQTASARNPTKFTANHKLHYNSYSDQVKLWLSKKSTLKDICTSIQQ